MKEKGKEQIVAKVLKEVVKEKEGQGKEEVKLKQMEGGRDLNVTLGKVVKEGVVDAEVVAKVKKRSGFKQTKHQEVPQNHEAGESQSTKV